MAKPPPRPLWRAQFDCLVRPMSNVSDARSERKLNPASVEGAIRFAWVYQMPGVVT
jgi:hypothetical protein